MVAWLKQNRPETLEKCPAFNDGCPFKGASSEDEMKKIMEALPESHRGSGGPQHAALVDMFNVMGAVTDSVRCLIRFCHVMVKIASPTQFQQITTIRISEMPHAKYFLPFLTHSFFGGGLLAVCLGESTGWELRRVSCFFVSRLALH